MCKPAIRNLAIHIDGPCRFSVRSYDDACAAYSLGWSWRASLANVLRRLADKSENTKSIVLVASAPSQITFDDVADATSIGVNAATKYMNDLWRDRVYGSDDVTARSVLSIRTVKT